jgi:ferritin-like metal-binding protein YciE
MAQAKTMDDLFLHFLQDIYYAERQIVRALPKMARAASSPDLKKACETHKEETQGQIERLEQIFEMLDKRARGTPCEAIQGIIEEAKGVMDEADDPQVRDAGIIAAAQAVEHYEMARYGTLCAWARTLGRDDAAKLLAQTLKEEEATDKTLSGLAEGSVNVAAAEAA